MLKLSAKFDNVYLVRARGESVIATNQTKNDCLSIYSASSIRIVYGDISSCCLSQSSAWWRRSRPSGAATWWQPASHPVWRSRTNYTWLRCSFHSHSHLSSRILDLPGAALRCNLDRVCSPADALIGSDQQGIISGDDCCRYLLTFISLKATLPTITRD